MYISGCTRRTVIILLEERQITKILSPITSVKFVLLAAAGFN